MTTDLTYLRLAQKVYQDFLPDANGKLPEVKVQSTIQSGRSSYVNEASTATEETWQVVKAQQGGADFAVGFAGAILQRDNEYVVALRGSDQEIEDFALENATLYWDTPQVKAARIMISSFLAGKTEAELSGATFNFVGHSLGGKLAQTMLVEATDGEFAKMIGKVGRAIIFNAAPTQNPKYEHGDTDPSIAYMPKNEASTYNVDHYMLEGEVLNTLLGDLGVHFGRQHRLGFGYEREGKFENALPSWVDRHNAFDAFQYMMDDNGQFLKGTVKGTQGNDTYHGSGLAAVIDAGLGDDILYGETSIDQDQASHIYWHEAGDGHDTIYEYGETSNQIVFQNISKANVTAKETIEIMSSPQYPGIEVEIKHLTLSYTEADGTSGSITIKNYPAKAFMLSFADAQKQIYDTAKLSDIPFLVEGTDQDDELEGHAGADVIRGRNGNDTLKGLEGSDALEGGQGLDSLYGGIGSDTYRFARGDGIDHIFEAGNDIDDTLELKGYSVEDVTTEVDYRLGTLTLTFAETGDKIVIHDAVDGVGVWKNALEKIRFENGNTYELKHLITEPVPEQTESVTRYGTENDDWMVGGREQTTLYGRKGNDYLYGGAGNDALYGEEGNDYLVGGAGQDILYGSQGNDILEGGAGNDVLVGNYNDGNTWSSSRTNYSGSDTYVFGRGYGQDTIEDYDWKAGVVDRLKLKLNPNEIDVLQVSGNLVIQIQDTKESISVLQYFSAGTDTLDNKIELVEFADGTIWTQKEIEDRVITRGTEGEDRLYGVNTFNDRMYGLAGTDVMSGLDGDDMLYGGTGNDELYGDFGSDLLYGEEGNDKLYGSAGNDVLDGGAGNDVLVGNYNDGNTWSSTHTNYSGSDTYVFGRGYGQDTIEDYDWKAGVVDRLKLKLNPNEIDVLQVSGNLVIQIQDTKESISVLQYFSAGTDTLDNKIEVVEFADGTIWTQQEIEDHVIARGTQGADTLYGIELFDDRIYGVNNNDNLHDKNGNDYVNSNDNLIVSNCYTDAKHETEEFQTQDGLQLRNTQVQQLIQAMATFEANEGVAWSQAMNQKNDTAMQILAEYWKPQ